MQTRLSIVSNILFKYTLIFFISFLWIGSLIENLLIVLLISILCSIILGKILGIVYNKKQQSISESLKEQKKMVTASNQLLLCNDYKKVIDFFLKLFSDKPNLITTEKAIFWENFVFIPLYNTRKIYFDKVLEIYKTYHSIPNIVISGISFDDESMEFVKSVSNVRIHLFDEKNTFRIFKKHNLYPDFNITLKEKDKINFSKIKELIFSKRNTRNYFMSGIIILISSIFIRYNIYYLCFATLLFIMSGICFFKRESPSSSIIDEL